MKIGTSTVTAIYLGTTSIVSAYLGATQVFGGASAFTPLDLFSTGAQGIWLDPSDLSTMFSDRAGTIPVTTPGTVVGKRLDKSGRGNHAVAATDAARPIYGVEPKGGRRNLLTQTEAFNEAGWVKTSQNSATAPVVTANAGTSPIGDSTAERVQFARTGTTTTDRSRLEQVSIPIAASTVYTFSFWVKSFSGIDQTIMAVPNFGLGTAYVFTATSEWQRFSVSANSSAATTATVVVGLGYTASSETSSDILLWGAQFELDSTATNYQRVLSAYDVTESGVATTHYVQYDGSDDSMSTPAIDFTGTDKMSVFAGVRKLSDAASGEPIGLSADPSANNGAFSIEAPNVFSNVGYWSELRGSTRIYTNTGSFGSLPAPRSNVLAFLYDIGGAAAADELRARVDGVAATIVYNGTSAGTGNFGNYPLFFGRRNNATIPFNGRDYGIIVVGKAASAGEITDTETWLAARTSGVSI